MRKSVHAHGRSLHIKSLFHENPTFDLRHGRRRILRLLFGAALTEILRALVLHGQDRDGTPYERVVLDSMSGASAGAIALAILMRSLMDYKAVAATIVKKYRLEEKEDSPRFLCIKGKKEWCRAGLERFYQHHREKSPKG
jgi:hypothetical protein